MITDLRAAKYKEYSGGRGMILLTPSRCRKDTISCVNRDCHAAAGGLGKRIFIYISVIFFFFCMYMIFIYGNHNF